MTQKAKEAKKAEGVLITEATKKGLISVLKEDLALIDSLKVVIEMLELGKETTNIVLKHLRSCIPK